MNKSPVHQVLFWILEGASVNKVDENTSQVEFTLKVDKTVNKQ